MDFRHLPKHPPTQTHTPALYVQLFPRQAHLWSILSPPVHILEPKTCVCGWPWPPVTSSPSHSVSLTDMCSGCWECKCFFLGRSHHVQRTLQSVSREMACFHGSLSNLASLSLPKAYCSRPKSTPAILAFRLPLHQHITHTSAQLLSVPSDLVALERPRLAVLVRWCRVTPPGRGSDAGTEQCVLAVTACLSLSVTSLRAAGSYFLLTVWLWPDLQLQLCLPASCQA